MTSKELRMLLENYSILARQRLETRAKLPKNAIGMMMKQRDLSQPNLDKVETVLRELNFDLTKLLNKNNMKNQKTIAATGIYQLLLRGGSPEVTRSWNGQSFDIESQSDRDNSNLESVKGSELETELAKAVAFLNDMYENHGWAITIDDICIEEVTD